MCTGIWSSVASPDSVAAQLKHSCLLEYGQSNLSVQFVQCDVPNQWIAQGRVNPMSVYCDGVSCLVSILWRGGVSCPLYNVMGVISCVCILWRGGVSCPLYNVMGVVSFVYSDGVGCRVVCIMWWVSCPLYTLTGWGVAWRSCVAAHSSQYHCYVAIWHQMLERH